MLAADPDVPLAVGLVIAAASVCSGALTAAVLLSVPLGEGGRRRRPASTALRRGIEVTAVVGVLLVLRVIDGLTIVTGGFIILGFAVAEVILSARPTRASR
jgi:hypothetical protein